MQEQKESVETIEPPIVQVPPRIVNKDPDLLARLFEQMTPTGREALNGAPLFKSRTITFEVDGSQCSPEVFVDADGNYYDFELTMRSLNSSEEMKALDGVTGGNAATQFMCKAMLWKFNGAIITPRQRDWLWEALDLRGRQLCFLTYQQLAGPSSVALGKYHSSFTIG